MERRGRKPKGIAIDDLEPTLREEIVRAIESSVDQSVRSLYAQFGLAQRGVGWASFEKWAGKIRRDARGQRVQERLASMDAEGETEEQLIAKLRRRVLVEANARAEEGDTKAYELVALWSRIMDHDRLDIDKAAEARAKEKHDAWRKEVEKSIRSTLDDESNADKKSFTREDVYDMIDKVMRGS